MKAVKYLGFWVVSCTWGGLMTFIGALIAFSLLISGHKPRLFHCFVYFEIGKSWGGVNFGGFFFVSSVHSLHTKQHESGHGIQNIMLGIFMPFIIGIPSMIRYWHRRWIYRTDKEKYATLPAYDAIWFEGWATSLGSTLHD